MDIKVFIFAILLGYCVLLMAIWFHFSKAPTIVRQSRDQHSVALTTPVTIATEQRDGIAKKLEVVTMKLNDISLENNNFRHNKTKTKVGIRKSKHYVTCKWHYLDGIGNQLFQYAAVYAIGRANNLTVLMPKYTELGQELFTLSAERTHQWRPGLDWVKHWTGRDCCQFYPDTMHLYKDPHFKDKDVEVRGYRQSWKYFRDYESEIRCEFTFQPPIQHTADTFIKSAINMTAHRGKQRKNLTIIGIHVRRGDLITPNKLEYGHIESKPAYFKRAMDYYKAKHNHGNLLFIICSDDIPWCEDNIKSDGKTKLIFSRNNTAAVDMAILGNCDHMIISQGTFGWWSAWLAGGSAIYDKSWPRKGSPLDISSVKRHDYFYPGWIPM